MEPHTGLWADRPQNKPERNQAVSKMESGPWALAECNCVLWSLLPWVLRDLVRLENSRGIFYRMSPTRPMQMHELHSEATRMLTLTNSSSLPSLPMATPSLSIWHAIPSVTLTFLHQQHRDGHCLQNVNIIWTRHSLSQNFSLLFSWSIFPLITKTKQFLWQFR